MKIFFVLLFVSFIVFDCAHATPSNEKHYEVAVLDKHGTSCNFYLQYSIDDESLSSKPQIDQVHIRIDEELSKIADEYVMIDLINIIDSIGLRIENELKDEFDLKNLTVLEIGVASSIKEYLVKTETDVSRVKALSDDEIKNYAGSTKFKSQVNSTSEELTLAARTKYDSEVLLKYVIYFSNQNNSGNPVNSLNEPIQNAMIDSLRQFDMYQMWATKRGSLSLIMEDIIRTSYPSTYEVEIRDIVIPEEAEQKFRETERLRQVSIDSIFKIEDRRELLSKKLEMNKDLSESEIVEIEKEMMVLEEKLSAVKEKGKLLKQDYKL